MAVQISERVGRDNVIQAARDLGVTSPLTRPRRACPWGSQHDAARADSAYAAVAAGRYPIRPHGLPLQRGGWFAWSDEDRRVSRDRAFPMLRDVLYAVVNRGTGRAAALAVPTFGKTGTTSDYRDALFVGFAGDLVVGIWVGNDDNRPLPGTAGGGLPARIWRAFMSEALGTRAAAPVAAVPLYQADRRPEANAAEPSEPAEPPSRRHRKIPSSRNRRAAADPTGGRAGAEA